MQNDTCKSCRELRNTFCFQYFFFKFCVFRNWEIGWTPGVNLWKCMPKGSAVLGYDAVTKKKDPEPLHHWRWRHYVPWKRGKLLTQHHGVIVQKAWIHRNKAVRTSDLALYIECVQNGSEHRPIHPSTLETKKKLTGFTQRCQHSCFILLMQGRSHLRLVHTHNIEKKYYRL